MNKLMKCLGGEMVELSEDEVAEIMEQRKLDTAGPKPKEIEAKVLHDLDQITNGDPLMGAMYAVLEEVAKAADPKMTPGKLRTRLNHHLRARHGG